MKTSNYISTLAALIILLSSCGNLSIVQKRYSRGLNISLFSAKADPAFEAKAKVQKAPKKALIAPNDIVLAEEATSEIEQSLAKPSPASVINVVMPSVAAPAKPARVYTHSSNKIQRVQAAHASSKMKTVAKQMLKMAPVKLSSVQNINQTHESDVNLLLLVILAILLPPLAVYLYFGEINIHFWLCLLFSLIGFGVGFIHLYWGFGAIYALLAVFGVLG